MMPGWRDVGLERLVVGLDTPMVNAMALPGGYVLHTADASVVERPIDRTAFVRKLEDAEAIANLNGFNFPSDVPAGILLKLPEEVGRDAS